MNALLFVLLLSVPTAAPPSYVYPDFNEHGKYSIVVDKVIGFKDSSSHQWIESHGKRITELASCEIYDNGRKIKLVSKLGFSFENIPYQKGKERFFNEAIHCFIDAEKRLPLAYQCLKDNGFKTREIKTVKFSFPNSAEINPKTGTTRFWSDMWVVGLTSSDRSMAYVTWGPSVSYDNVAAHEYIHMCGYGAEFHDKEVFQCAKKILK